MSIRQLIEAAIREKQLTTDQRAAVVRDTFDAVTAVGFMKWKAEELMGHGYRVTEEDRQQYFAEYRKDHFGDFQRMSANTPDVQLLDTRDYWMGKAKTMDLQAWKEVLNQGRGGKPFYEQVGREIEQRMALLTERCGGREM